MRNLQECEAEVFRRSKKRIQLQKRRQKAILAVCLPLVLCVTALFLRLLPAQPQKATDGLSPGTGGPVAEQLYENAASPERVQISGPGFSQTWHEADLVSEIGGQLEKYCAGSLWGNAENAMQESDEQLPPEASGGNHSSVHHCAPVYSIVLVREDGTRTEYSLTGSTLTNRALGQSCVLSPDQLQELKALLGIPDL